MFDFTKILNRAKKADIIDVILFVSTIFSVVAAVYYIFVYGAAYMHSDVVVSQRYANSVIESKSLFPATWNFAYGEIYSFRIIPFASLLSGIMTNQILARLLASAINILLVCVVIVCYSKKHCSNNSWLVVIPLFLVFIGGAEARSMILYEGVYQHEMLGLVLGIFWVYRANNVEKLRNVKWTIVGIAAMYILMGLQGKRHWAEFILPFVLTIWAYNFSLIRSNSTGRLLSTIIRSVKTTCLILVPSVIGHLAYKKVASTHLMNYGKGEILVFPDSFKELTKEFSRIIRLFFETFGFNAKVDGLSMLGVRNLVSIFMCIIICLIVPILQIKKLQHEKNEVKFLIYFGVIHNFLMLIIDICFAKDNQRYILSCIYVFILISARYIYVYWLKQTLLDKYLWVLLFGVAVFVEGITLLQETAGVNKYYESNKRVSETLKEYGLCKGFGSYWNTYMFEAYSDNEIRVGAINASDTGFEAYLALNDSRIYIPDSDKTFVMISEEEYEEGFGTGIGLLDRPADEFVIEDVYLYDFIKMKYYKSNLYVFIYDYDVSSRIKNGFSDGVLTVKDMEFNWLGTKDWDRFYLDKDGMVFGPYSVIEPGNYIVTYEGENMDALGCDVFSENAHKDNEEDSYSYTLVEQSPTKIVLNVKINKTLRDVQFRAVNTGDERCILNDILVERN